MHADAVQMIGFDEDDALNEIISGFGLLADYKSFLPEHLTDLLQKQHPTVKIRSLELLASPNCELGGMPAPENKSHVIVDSMKIPFKLRVLLTTTGADLHELEVTLVINANDVHKTPVINTDMLIQNHRVISVELRAEHQRGLSSFVGRTFFNRLMRIEVRA